MKKSLKDNREGQKPRRLTLSRETIQKLNAPELGIVRGGNLGQPLTTSGATYGESVGCQTE